MALGLSRAKSKTQFLQYTCENPSDFAISCEYSAILRNIPPHMITEQYKFLPFGMLHVSTVSPGDIVFIGRDVVFLQQSMSYQIGQDILPTTSGLVYNTPMTAQ